MEDHLRLIFRWVNTLRTECQLSTPSYLRFRCYSALVRQARGSFADLRYFLARPLIRFDGAFDRIGISIFAGNGLRKNAMPPAAMAWISIIASSCPLIKMMGI